eukprot:Gb_40926 [translate_table: standard]
MDDSVIGGTMLASSSAGMMELEGHLQHHQHHHQQQQQIAHQNHHQQLVHHHHLQAMGPLPVSHHQSTGLENEQSLALVDPKGTPKNSMICSKGKPTTSDEDEPSFTEDGTDSHLSGGKSKKNSPWQRMKWTDSMVRLLITAVLYVGEDGTPECTDGNKRKSGILQKKGKWKSVSKVMMDKSCFVSPQQCEDKFNDLNKRYKRLNDILGRGTTCRVVENPSLLDTMPHLSAKTKDDVRKLLSSKHLFYKEMCSYHNGNRMHAPPDLDLQPCVQSSMIAKSRDGHESCGLMKEDNGADEDDDDENEEEDDEDDADNDDENEGDAEVEGIGDFGKRRKMNKSSEEVNFWMRPISHECNKPTASDNLNAEMMGVLQDTNKTPWEQREWMRNRTMQLQEQKVNLQAQAFELEKQRFKWQKINSKKDRELERLKLENERMKLENERMALQLKQKELEIEFKRSEASMTSVALVLDRLQGRDQNELGRGQCLQ